MIHEIHPHRFNNSFVVANNIGQNDYIFHYKDNTLLLKVDGDQWDIPRKKDIPGLSGNTKCTFLFTLNDVSCFLAWDCPETDTNGFVYQEINFFRTLKQKEVAWISIVGFQLMNWYSQNQFCGKCGTKNTEKADERAMICPVCKTTVYPKISPAIIVAIVCNDKILLAHNANFKDNWYSLIAGYADVGESLEETVVREVKEEVGLNVKNIRYYKSQPWPYSGSMMIGFIAEGDDTQPICVDNNEITDAAWYTRGNLPNHPTTISIGGELIEKFENNNLI
jgi:NAD+ diphosphatase